jgi:hypothetical protein
MLAAGCAAASASSAPATQAASSSSSLNTSLNTAAGGWAAVVMSGSAAQYNNFWPLFSCPAGSPAGSWSPRRAPRTTAGWSWPAAGRRWSPGFGPARTSPTPPLIQTGNGGQAWSSLDPLDAALTSTPDALAAKPGSGQLLALLAGGAVQEAAPGNVTWTALAR